jgi:PAS domain S-box-containing protein
MEFNNEQGMAELLTLNEKLQQEVNEYKNKEQIFKERELHYSAILKAMFDTSCEVDSTGKYITVSSNKEKLTGFKPDEMIGKYFYEFVHPDDISKAVNAFKMGLTDSKTVVELCYRHKDGHYFWFESTGQKYETANGEIRAIIVAKDITDRKKLEEETIKSSKLESLGMLAGGIAHDFNNILMGIAGNVMLAKIKVSSEEKIFNMLTRIENIVEKAKKITAKLLTFSGGGMYIKKIIFVNELIKDIASISLVGSNINCCLELDEESLITEADEGQFLQVITNLIANAKESMPNGGEIKIKTEKINISKISSLLLFPGDYIKISVTDSGNGISMENIDKIFDPYFTTKIKSNGLGLTIAHSIIKKHNGLIAVESEVSQGSTFYVYIPLKKIVSEIATDTSNKIIEKLKNKKILIMDDDDMVIIPISEMLCDLGYEVLQANNGEKAIEIYQKAINEGKKIDVTILDLIIQGGLNGYDTLKSLLKINPHIKAIVSSGYSDTPIISDYKHYGFIGALVKPYKKEEIINILENIPSNCVIEK